MNVRLLPKHSAPLGSTLTYDIYSESGWPR